MSRMSRIWSEVVRAWERVPDYLQRALASGSPEQVPPPPARGSISVEDHSASLHFRAKRANTVRLRGELRPSEELPPLLADVALSGVEVIEARSPEFSDAAPTLDRPRDAMQWLQAHSARGPIARHALLVLESAGAADMAVDTLACALLHGELDAAGYPEEDAVVGGLASRWDEVDGDLLVRAVVGWGGRGLRGDTERNAQRLVAALHGRLVARARTGKAESEGGAPPTLEHEGDRCPHCGFDLQGDRAVFCPKCGMRLTHQG